MEILVLGNGFDIASGLPTRYRDFLHMAELAASSVKTPLQREFIRFNSSTNTVMQEIDSLIRNMTDSEVEEFIDISKHNFWIQYFLYETLDYGDKWIDFEEGIRVVTNSMFGSSKKEASLNIKESVYRAMQRAHGNKRKTNYEIMEQDLLTLKRAMELYFDGYVRFIPVKKIPEFTSHKYNHVISFNYTSTYSENYWARGERCYIHGVADKSRKIDDCNLVLGFNHQSIDEDGANLALIPYEKYYQRIVNRTDNEFYRWIAELPNDEGIELFFFGHSMAPSDGDIIEKLICNERAHTLIFYLDEKDRADKIKNLAAVLGPERLVELAGGINPNIEFRKQEQD